MFTLTWTELATFLTARSLSVQYVDSNDQYILAGIDGDVVATAIIYKTTPANADQTDFETNYMPSGNAATNTRLPMFGQTTSSGSLPVVLSSNQSSIPVNSIGSGGTYTNKSISTAAKACVSTSALTGRKSLMVTPVDKTIYWGWDASVTTANGQPISALSTAIWDISDAQEVYVISSSGSADVRITEGK